jgi:hypothetical protein
VGYKQEGATPPNPILQIQLSVPLRWDSTFVIFHLLPAYRQAGLLFVISFPQH